MTRRVKVVVADIVVVKVVETIAEMKAVDLGKEAIKKKVEVAPLSVSVLDQVVQLVHLKNQRVEHNADSKFLKVRENVGTLSVST
jgi:hypothetical protein